uniref:BZIP domain-containing protein n=1 Tax=Oryza punctata TaxID=4537 RepID=A0A0E0LGM2_ORYPU
MQSLHEAMQLDFGLPDMDVGFGLFGVDAAAAFGYDCVASDAAGLSPVVRAVPGNIAGADDGNGGDMLLYCDGGGEDDEEERRRRLRRKISNRESARRDYKIIPRPDGRSA